MHIGIAGIGNMGSNIGARLMEVGHKLTVWNRTAEKTKPLADAGAAVAKTPAELTSSVEVVISLLIDAAAIDAVYHGPQGLLAGDTKGKLFIEMSHGDAGGADRAGGEGARHRRRLRRMPGERLGDSGAGRQAARPDGRGAGRRGARPAAARTDVPARDACRAGRLRRGAQARGQPAADDLLAGARRAAFHVQDADDRSGGTAGFPRRDLGRRHRAQAAHAGHRCQAQERAVEPTNLQPRWRHQGRQTDAGGRREARPRAAAAEADARLLRGGNAHMSAATKRFPTCRPIGPAGQNRRVQRRM